MRENNMRASKQIKKKRRRRGFFVFEVIVLLILVAGLVVYSKLNSKLTEISNKPIDRSKIGVNEGVEDNKALHGFTTIALVGLDTRTNEKNSSENSDTMIIVSIDNDTQKVKLVSLYRDTYLNIGNDIYTKSNAAYATGGPEQFLTMLNKNLDLNITDYVTVNFNSMVEAIDQLGGIDFELTAEEAVYMNDYCQGTSEVTGGDYEEIPEEDGTYHLNGIQAVSYARIRYTAGGDFTRAARQRLLVDKMVAKAKESDFITLTKMLNAVVTEENVRSSLSKEKMLSLGKDMFSYEIEDQTGFPFAHLEGENVTDALNGKDVVLPVTLVHNVTLLHQFLYPDEAYMPSATVEEYSDTIVERSGYGEDSIPENSDQGLLPQERGQ